MVYITSQFKTSFHTTHVQVPTSWSCAVSQSPVRTVRSGIRRLPFVSPPPPLIIFIEIFPSLYKYFPPLYKIFAPLYRMFFLFRNLFLSLYTFYIKYPPPRPFFFIEIFPLLYKILSFTLYKNVSPSLQNVPPLYKIFSPFYKIFSPAL